jgi:hypothetical protein
MLCSYGDDVELMLRRLAQSAIDLSVFWLPADIPSLQNKSTERPLAVPRNNGNKGIPGVRVSHMHASV